MKKSVNPSPDMNQEKVQNTFIGLLSLGLVIAGVGVYILGQQLHNIGLTMTQIQAELETPNAPQQPQAVAPVDTNSIPTPDKNIFSYQGLEFSYPKTWTATENQQAGFWVFTEGGKQVAGLACPDENSPGPDPLLQTETKSYSYVENGQTLTAVLTYNHFRTDDFWMTGIDFGHPNRCDLVLSKKTAPTAEDRAIFEAILSSVK